MSKNITIAREGQVQSFYNVSKIRTNVIDGGTQNWVPDDEAAQYANFETLSVNENGTYSADDEECDGFSSVQVNVSAKLTSKDISSNGTYYAKNDNADGYSSVTVNVKGGGGGGGGGADYYYPVTEIANFPHDPAYSNGGTVWNGKSYALSDRYNASLFVTTDGTWSKVCDFPSGILCRSAQLVVYNNELYAVSMSNRSYALYNQLWKFNGSEFEYISTAPIIMGGASGHAVYNGAIYNMHGYAWNGSEWIPAPAMGDSASFGRRACAVYNGQLYGIIYESPTLKLCRLNGDSWEEILDMPDTSLDTMLILKDKLHFLGSGLHYSYNGKFVRSEELLPIIPYIFAPAPNNNDMYICGQFSNQYKATYTT